MKKHHLLVLILAASLACPLAALAQLVIPSDGSDGAFAPDGSVTNVVIDLSLARDGVWNADNSANAGNGIYDPDKWAVVFKYSAVNIPAGVTVKFKNHRSRAPVVWLVQGQVTISGVVDLSGENQKSGIDALIPAEPGPGGFRGGPDGPAGSGSGLGPGGIGPNYYASQATYESSYGNPRILPLIGGSGAGASTSGAKAGAAGGGALMIATSSDASVNGQIQARGGGNTQKGSGGAVRIIAGQVGGSGEINCLNEGRIRIEANALAASLRTYPETIAVPPATPPLIWPPEAAPRVRIVSVDSLEAPNDPTAPLVSQADIALQSDQPVIITLETINFPIEGIVQLRTAQKWGGSEWKKAAYVSGNQAQAFWRTTNTFVKGYTTLQARATAP